MRTIKFRAWDGKEMYQPMYQGGGWLGCWRVDEKEHPIMQFTGLLDKNGVEIYEGDLIELENWEPKQYEVVFDRGGFCLKFGEDGHFYPDIKYAEDSVVVGNIYENKR